MSYDRVIFVAFGGLSSQIISDWARFGTVSFLAFGQSDDGWIFGSNGTGVNALGAIYREKMRKGGLSLIWVFL